MRGRSGLPVLTLPARSLVLRGGARTRVRALTALAEHGLQVRRLSRALEPRLIVTWGMRSAIAWRGGSAARPAVIAHHDFLPGPLIGLAMRAAAARADAVVVPSQAVARDLDPRGRLGERLHVIPPGVDVQRFATAAEPAIPPEVLVLGALEEWKRSRPGARDLRAGPPAPPEPAAAAGGSSRDRRLGAGGTACAAAPRLRTWRERSSSPGRAPIRAATSSEPPACFTALPASPSAS